MTTDIEPPTKGARFDDLPFRFRQKIRRSDADCWTWTAAVSGGYGKFWHNGRLRYAHVVAYELLVGPVPDGLQVDHLCHTRGSECPGGWDCLHRRCVNPAHLNAVTQRANILRGTSPSAFHAQKTHCPYGHEYAGANLRISNGQRVCRTCEREKQRKPPRTECRNGHPLTDSYTNAKGLRICRPCSADRRRRYFARKAVA